MSGRSSGFLDEVQDATFQTYGDKPGTQLIANGQAMQRVGNQYATAITVQKPRNLNEVMRRVLDEARLGGEDMYYSWSVRDAKGNLSVIEGPSINLAMSICRNYGNCVAGILEDVEDHKDSWVFTGTFVDLETGFTFSRKFRQSKRSTVGGRMDDERKDDIRFQIGQSKAIRNTIIAAMPSVFVDKAIREAKAGVTKMLEKLISEHGIAKVQDKAVNVLKRLGVEEDLILERFHVTKRDALTLEHLTTMQGDVKALENGQERPDALYPPKQEKSGNEKTLDQMKPLKEDTPPASGGKEGPVKTTTDDINDRQVRELKEKEAERKIGDVAKELPDWVNARRSTFSGVEKVDRLLHPVTDLAKGYAEAATENDRFLWAGLLEEAAEHAAKLCAGKAPVLAIARKTMENALKPVKDEVLREALLARVK